MNRTGQTRILVPAQLRDSCAGAKALELGSTSVRAALIELEERYPALHRTICDETGAVRRHLNLFVNVSHIRDLDGLDTKLAPGDELIVLPAVSGG